MSGGQKFGPLSALCNGSADDVWPKKSIRSVAKNLGLGETAADQEQAAFYLRQFEICTLSDDSVEGDQWKYVLGSMFTGNPDDVYDVLLNLTENDNYGKTLTAGILQQYLEQRGDTSAGFWPPIPISHCRSSV